MDLQGFHRGRRLIERLLCEPPGGSADPVLSNSGELGCLLEILTKYMDDGEDQSELGCCQSSRSLEGGRLGQVPVPEAPKLVPQSGDVDNAKDGLQGAEIAPDQVIACLPVRKAAARSITS